MNPVFEVSHNIHFQLFNIFYLRTKITQVNSYWNIEFVVQKHFLKKHDLNEIQSDIDILVLI